MSGVSSGLGRGAGGDGGGEAAGTQLSARNRLKGTVTAITLAAVMAEVTVDIGDGTTIVAAVTRSSVEQLALRQGPVVVAVVKATDVLIGTR